MGNVIGKEYRKQKDLKHASGSQSAVDGGVSKIAECDYKLNGWECKGGWMSPNFEKVGVCSYVLSPCPKCNKDGQPPSEEDC